jgi:hypothetical protein
MKRWVRHVRTTAICLLLGVALTVVVTWTLAGLLPSPQGRPVGLGPVPDPGPVPAWFGEGDDMIASKRTDALGQRMSIWGFRLDDPGRTRVLVRVDYGILAPALRRYHFEQFPPLSGPSLPKLSWLQTGVQNPMARSQATFGRGRLPVLPIWPGFAIDVAAFATLCWLLLLGSLGVRRTIRRRHDHCVACGYDLRGFNTCPECGGKARRGDG